MAPQSELAPPTVVEKYPLLTDHSDSEYQDESSIPHKEKPTRGASWSILSALLATLLVGLSAGFSVSYYISNKPCQPQDMSYTLAKDVLSYSKQRMHPHGPKTYWGPPTIEQTKAWEKLLEPVMIRASYDEMAQVGESPESSVQLSAGGYLASLGVYHDLHCLRRIRFFLYQDHFYPNMTAMQRDEEAEHVEHCLEALRVGTMCSGSTGLWSFEWTPKVTRVHAKTEAQRTCVDWDAIDGWARERAVGFKPSLKPRPQSP